MSTCDNLAPGCDECRRQPSSASTRRKRLHGPPGRPICLPAPRHAGLRFQIHDQVDVCFSLGSDARLDLCVVPRSHPQLGHGDGGLELAGRGHGGWPTVYSLCCPELLHPTGLPTPAAHYL